MNCKKARQRWHTRLDKGVIDAELDRHLADCEACRTYAAGMERLVGLMDELHEDTEALIPSVSPEVAHHAYRIERGWSPTITRRFLRIAAAVVLTVSAGLWYRAEQSPTVVERHPSTAVSTTGITLRAESRNRYIAVAVPSTEPNVQTYWLYPSVTVTESQDRS